MSVPSFHLATIRRINERVAKGGRSGFAKFAENIVSEHIRQNHFERQIDAGVVRPDANNIDARLDTSVMPATTLSHPVLVSEAYLANARGEHDVTLTLDDANRYRVTVGFSDGGDAVLFAMLS